MVSSSKSVSVNQCQIFIFFLFQNTFLSAKTYHSWKKRFPPQNQYQSKVQFSNIKCRFIMYNMINFHTQCANLSYCIWYQIFISFQFVVTVCQQKLITQGKNSFPPENQFKSKWCKIFIFFPRFLITFCQKILSLMVKNDVFSKISISQKCSFQTKDAD